MVSPIVDFYSGKKPDSEGRFIGEIHSWGNNKLEYTHDYIQWLFPLREASHFNLRAPMLKEEDIIAFHKDKNLRDKLLVSFDLMLNFYGFERKGLFVSCSDDWDIKSNNWLSIGNHNFLRITRILSCLSLLGLQEYASAFFSTLSYLYNSGYRHIIGEITYGYWSNASE
jgi:hypothetical protein